MENQLSIEDQFLRKVHQIIDENLSNDQFSVEDLASNIGLSRSMLHRKLKKFDGKSAGDLITEKRLNHAKQLLEDNIATASEVAYMVGFKSPSYFNKVFKSHFNTSPGTVRKNHVANCKFIDLKKEHSKNDSFHQRSIVKKTALLIFILVVMITSIGVYTLIALNNPFEKSIAVLPLKNLTGQEDNSYFIDGIHDALIGELGKIASLRVISRTSTLRYRHSDMLLKDIAKELGVNTIVEGSVMTIGDSLRILIQVIDVIPSERHILAKHYQYKINNLLTVQTSAVKDIAENIKVQLSKNKE
jgi:TolB-like protein/AraC-like DNA-binding protein